MKIILYSEDEIDLIREASEAVATCHEVVRELAKPGMTTKKIDEAVAEQIKLFGGTSAFLGYASSEKDEEPFPATTCTSLNEVVVHGVPNDKPLEEGDLLSVDIGIKLDGYIGDSAWTYAIGEVDEEARRLMAAGERALRKAIKTIKVRTSLMDIARAINNEAEADGFTTVRSFTGHGVGKELHEFPPIYNYIPESAKDRKALSQVALVPGTVVAIEPMVNAGGWEVEKSTGWPVVTKDRRRSVHYEHTVAVTPRGPEVLTLKSWEKPF